MSDNALVALNTWRILNAQYYKNKQPNLKIGWKIWTLFPKEIQVAEKHMERPLINIISY